MSEDSLLFRCFTEKNTNISRKLITVDKTTETQVQLTTE